MKERPILFNSAMIQALPNKSQTRRTRNLNFVNKNPDRFKSLGFVPKHEALKTELSECIARFYDIEENRTLLFKNPYGTIGDRLWVREAWRPALSESHECFAYKADNKYRCGKSIPENCNQPWKPSIHMPKKACRFKLEVTNIRVERVHDISEEDAIAEGIESYETDSGICYRNYSPIEVCVESPITSFATLWNSIHGVNSWKSNPWCWVVEFQKWRWSDNAD